MIMMSKNNRHRQNPMAGFHCAAAWLLAGLLASGCGPAQTTASGQEISSQRSETNSTSQPAGETPSIEVTRLSDYLLFFFDGRHPTSGPAQDNWVADAAMKLGIGTYAIHRGNEAIVYDTFTSVAQAKWVREYLEKQGIDKFTVVQSHWHLDHIAGNAVYADGEIISSSLTKKLLEEKKADIEAGKVWGPPAIEPLVLPTATFDGQTTRRLGGLEIQLHNVNIHSKDTTIIYIPSDKIALVGDTLEDPLTYMVEIGELPNHVAGLRAMRAMDIAAIYPNHGDPAVIKAGGYQKTLIDATIAYITKMLAHAHDPDYLEGSMEDYIGDALGQGWVHAFEPYREVHKMNLGLIHKHYKERPLPVIPDAPTGT